MTGVIDVHFPCTTSLCIFGVRMTCLNKLHKTFLSQILFQHAHLSWPAVFSLILVTLTDAYVHSVGYVCSVMPFSEIDVMCCIKCIKKAQGVSCMQFINNLSTVLNFTGNFPHAWTKMLLFNISFVRNVENQKFTTITRTGRFREIESNYTFWTCSYKYLTIQLKNHPAL